VALTTHTETSTRMAEQPWRRAIAGHSKKFLRELPNSCLDLECCVFRNTTGKNVCENFMNSFNKFSGIIVAHLRQLRFLHGEGNIQFNLTRDVIMFKIIIAKLRAKKLKSAAWLDYKI
jgi:hypothetical protein